MAAELILGCKEPVRFLEKEDEREETYEDFDFFLYTKLIDARSLIFKMLQDRKTPVSLRLSMVLALGHDFQGRIRRNRLYEADALFTRYEREDRIRYFEEKKIQGSRYDFLKKLFSLLGEMEPLNLKWPSRRGKIEGSLYGNGEEAYKKAWNVCLKACPELELWTEQLMVYFVFTYFCGSD